MKKRLKKLLQQKNARKAEISKQADTSNDVTELRAINTELDTINAEIRDVQAMLDELDEKVDPTNERTAAVTGTVPGIVATGVAERKSIDEEDMEFRQAFQKFVTAGTPIPTELRVDASTKTTDITSVIPTILVNKIVETLENTGMILPLVTRTAFTAGVTIPSSSVKPVATWVGEGEGSDRQKKTTSTAITFTNFKLRCEISMSMEASVMALSAFEAAFVRQVTEAMSKAIEGAIISTAVGTSSPRGILAETPPTGQLIEAAELTYKLLVETEAAIPQAYENGGVWCMTKKTFMGFIGMVDTNKQPIARVNYGIGGTPERTLLGRSVVLCGDYLDSFSTTLATGKVFAFIFKFSDYTLNTTYNMGVQRKQDWDTEDLLTKAVMSVDGKVVDKNSLVILKKKAGA